jgi:hypothetical protein
MTSIQEKQRRLLWKGLGQTWRCWKWSSRWVVSQGVKLDYRSWCTRMNEIYLFL